MFNRSRNSAIFPRMIAVLLALFFPAPAMVPPAVSFPGSFRLMWGDYPQFSDFEADGKYCSNVGDGHWTLRIEEGQTVVFFSEGDRWYLAKIDDAGRGIGWRIRWDDGGLLHSWDSQRVQFIPRKESGP